MKPLESSRGFLWALVLVLVAFICTGSGVKQELWFYDAQNNGLHFQSHVPDTSEYSWFFPKVTTMCTRGMWTFFPETNFKPYASFIGSTTFSDILCRNHTNPASSKSFRYMGASDTNTDALSLYDGYVHSGKEIFITARALTGITNTVNNIAITGTSEWMLFEGQELDGNSTCYKIPSPELYVYYSGIYELGLSTIGSVFKGCDLREIQNYKMLYSPKLVDS